MGPINDRRLGVRFGILVDNPFVARWQADAIRMLMERAGGTPVLILRRSSPWRPPFPPVWQIYARLLTRVAAGGTSVPLPSLLPDVPVRVCTPLSDGAGEALAPADVAAVREAGLDVLLQFGFGPLHGDILEAVPHGVWLPGYEWLARHGDPPGFWEIMQKQSVTAMSLWRCTATGGLPLVHGRVQTISFWYPQQVATMTAATSAWYARAANGIALGMSTRGPEQHAVPSIPSTVQVVLFILRGLCALLRFLITYLAVEDSWSIGVVEAPIETMLEKRPPVRWLDPPSPNSRLADPFGFPYKDSVAVLAEDLNVTTRTGTIVAFEVPVMGEASSPRPVITPATHVAYPYLLDYNSEVYCIPDTGDAREVALYRAVAFPYRWERIGTLLNDFPALDSTVFQHGDYWWLLCADQETGRYSTLYGWFAPSLFGPWTPHPLNPLKTDITSARPAGTLFQHGGALYRPAQDCGRTYGGAVTVNRVLRLTPSDFAEETIMRLTPDPSGLYPDGLHTLSAAGHFTLIDGKRRGIQPRAILTKVRRLTNGARGRF